MPNSGTFCRRTRREFLWEAGGGFTAAARLFGVDVDAGGAQQRIGLS